LENGHHVEACLLLLLLIIYRLLRLCPSLNCPHPANILTLYVNFSLWVWVVFLILALAVCSIGEFLKVAA
jgi:hypothetical protein